MPPQVGAVRDALVVDLDDEVGREPGEGIARLARGEFDDAWKFADSRITRVVLSLMALSAPPITPASAMAPAASAITRFDASSG